MFGSSCMVDRSCLVCCICSLGYVSFQPVVRPQGCDLCRSLSVKVPIKEPLVVIIKSRLSVESEFPLKKHVTMIICLTSNSWGYECALEASLNKTNYRETVIQAEQCTSPHLSPTRTYIYMYTYSYILKHWHLQPTSTYMYTYMYILNQRHKLTSPR